jgi:hypothetical protein
MKPTHERLLEALTYNPDTGEFVWNIDVCNIKSGDVAGGKDEYYLAIQLDGYRTRSHRWAWFYVHGEWPTKELDHINGNKRDNRISNLRAVSRSENCRNIAMNRKNTSGVMGVVWHKPSERWKAEIGVNGKRKCLGYFMRRVDAVCARKAAELTYNYHPNHGRAVIL